MTPNRTVTDTSSLITCLTLSLTVLLPISAFGEHIKERVLIKFKASVSDEKIQQKLAAGHAKSKGKLHNIDVHVVTLPPGLSEEKAAKYYGSDPDVEFAEVDQLVRADEVMANDPLFSSQWQLGAVGAPSAWSVTTGSSQIIIAILDSGVDGTHEDLASRLVPGWNAFENNSNTNDVHGHGTKVAGSAAGATNNGIGIAGLCAECRIMPIRVTDTAGWASYSAIASGLTWAADRGARVANASFNVSGSSTVSSAAKYFNSKRGVFTTSSGNEGKAATTSDDPYMITVGGTDPSDALYSWSNYGNNIDVVAPGCVVTSFNGGGYGSACGTSFAAPVTAGVVGLIMSANPNLSASEVMNILKQSADDVGQSGWDSYFGQGRVNAARGVTMALNTYSPPGLLDTTAPSAPVNLSGEVVTTTKRKGRRTITTTSVSLVWGQSTDNVGVTSYKIYRNGVLVGTSNSSSYSDVSTAAGTYYGYQVLATDAAGNISSLSNLAGVQR